MIRECAVDQPTELQNSPIPNQIPNRPATVWVPVLLGMPRVAARSPPVALVVGAARDGVDVGVELACFPGRAHDRRGVVAETAELGGCCRLGAEVEGRTRGREGCRSRLASDCHGLFCFSYCGMLSKGVGRQRPDDATGCVGRRMLQIGGNAVVNGAEPDGSIHTDLKARFLGQAPK